MEIGIKKPDLTQTIQYLEELNPKQQAMLADEIELAESYFGTKRVRGNVIELSRPQQEMDMARMVKYIIFGC